MENIICSQGMISYVRQEGKVIPIELTFINLAERITFENLEKNMYSLCRFTNYLKTKYIDRSREFTILKAYGWNDFVIFSKKPLSLEGVRLSEISVDNTYFPGLSESSVLGWIMEGEYYNNTCKNAELLDHYLRYISLIKRIFPSLCRNPEKVKFDDFYRGSNSEGRLDLYVLSFITLNRDYENKNLDPDKLRSLKCIKGGVIIHCVGIWDIITIVKINRTGDSIENIEKFKQKFLYSTLIKRSSSVILVSLNNKEIDLIRQRLGDITDRDKVNYFKSTIEDVLCS